MADIERARTRDALRRWAAWQKEIRDIERQLRAAEASAARSLEALMRVRDSAPEAQDRLAVLRKAADSAALCYGEVARRLQGALKRRKGEHECMNRLMEQLTPEERQVIELRYVMRLSYVAIGMRMGLSDRHARRYEQRAVNKLAAYRKSKRRAGS